MLEAPPDDRRGNEPGPQAPRMALLVTLGVLGGHTLVTVLNVLGEEPGAARLALLAVSLAALLPLQFACSTRRPHTWPVRVRVLTLCAQAVVTYVPLAWLGMPWGAMTGLLGGSVLLVVPGRLRWPLFALVTGAIVPIVVTLAGAGVTLYSLGVTLLFSLIIYGVSSLSGLVAELRETRRELAGMAVIQERLRVASDLHDLLSYSLSAIVLKSELGHRLIPSAPGRARSEVAAVLGIAGEALADVTLVATGYCDMSLAAEAESARSVLADAGIETVTELDCGPLPKELDTVLAIVLREAVTNALRHSKAEHCAIAAVREGGTVTLRIRNDGVRETGPDTVGGGGSGLGNLATRVRDVGGDLAGRPTDDGWFEVLAHAPVEPVRGPEAGEDTDGAGDRTNGAGAGAEEHEPVALHWAVRMARGMLIAVLVGYVLIVLINAAGGAASGLELLGFLGCFAVVVALQFLHSLRRPRTWPARTRALTLVLQALATYAPLLWLGAPWGSMAGFFAGSLLITTAGTLRLWLYGAAVGVVAPLAVMAGVSVYDVVYLTDSSLVAGLVLYGFTVLYRLVIALHEARGALARLAVDRERLLVERELHEVLGSSLSTITMKCALVHRLLPGAPGPAQDELTTVLDLSRQSLADVRLVARGYRARPGAQETPEHRRSHDADPGASLSEERPFTLQHEDAAI
ncbi:histidine kinase [Streptomyces brevispora]|uniref:Histidine kinase n=1 Tax=Streptomyces brevispora TaxID=887462 RepID=A0ABZ1FVA8_9ACTN|nr:histidine kinase [Streptomyces brevispora]WSC11528.1 histidine kinase [Streptomyces brevispora]WSC17583.1 histidine kinase [Streptomyces brevispora]